jgi:hypothetical protein
MFSSLHAGPEKVEIQQRMGSKSTYNELPGTAMTALGLQKLVGSVHVGTVLVTTDSRRTMSGSTADGGQGALAEANLMVLDSSYKDACRLEVRLQQQV